MSTQSLDVDRLAEIIERTDMGMFWREEPRHINDPPAMHRMTFMHREYAEHLAREYRTAASEDEKQ